MPSSTLCRQQRHTQQQLAAAAFLAEACRFRSGTCCAAEAPLRNAGGDGSAAMELQPPVSSAATAADIGRLQSIRERMKQQRAMQPLASYSLHATQVAC